MTVKVGRRDFNPRVIHFAQRRFVFQPRAVIVQELLDLLHVVMRTALSEFLGGSVMLPLPHERFEG